jgi:hypothetical protein
MYWTGHPGQFLGTNKVVAHAGDLSEYLIRLGGFLRTGGCKMLALNATRYDVYLVVSSELSRDEFCDALYEHRLL